MKIISCNCFKEQTGVLNVKVRKGDIKGYSIEFKHRWWTDIQYNNVYCSDCGKLIEVNNE